MRLFAWSYKLNELLALSFWTLPGLTINLLIHRILRLNFTNLWIMFLLRSMPVAFELNRRRQEHYLICGCQFLYRIKGFQSLILYRLYHLFTFLKNQLPGPPAGYACAHWKTRMHAFLSPRSTRKAAPCSNEKHVFWLLLKNQKTNNRLWVLAENAFFKEVIQPQVPLRLPCYDFTPVMNHTVVTVLRS